MMGWTFQEYQEQPEEFIEAIIHWAKKDAAT